MSSKSKALLVFRFEWRADESCIRELEELAEAAGYSVVDCLVQTRAEDAVFNIGRGMLEKLKRAVKERGAEKVIFYNMLKPSQAYNLRKELGVEVIDRYELILEIFAERAGSKEAKLQIELARLKRELSFAREYINLSKRGELHGFLGGGKYAVDAYYTYVSGRIAFVERILEKIRRQKNMGWQRRGEAGLYGVSLAGYTGAGKSTLFEWLTRESTYIDGKPFATISTLARRTKLLGYPVVVVDTIGFIDSLPEQLVDSFYTTLEETLLTDVVVLVVDVSQSLSEVRRRFGASISLLFSLGVPFRKLVVAANKIDLLGREELEERLQVLSRSRLPVIPISAKLGLGLEELAAAIVSRFPDKKREVILVGSREGGVLSEALSKCKVLEVAGSPDGKIRLVLEGRASVVERLKARCSPSAGV